MDGARVGEEAPMLDLSDVHAGDACLLRSKTSASASWFHEFGRSGYRNVLTVDASVSYSGRSKRTMAVWLSTVSTRPSSQ